MMEGAREGFCVVQKLLRMQLVDSVEARLSLVLASARHRRRFCTLSLDILLW